MSRTLQATGEHAAREAIRMQPFLRDIRYHVSTATRPQIVPRGTYVPDRDMLILGGEVTSSRNRNNNVDVFFMQKSKLWAEPLPQFGHNYRIGEIAATVHRNTEAMGEAGRLVLIGSMAFAVGTFGAAAALATQVGDLVAMTLFFRRNRHQCEQAGEQLLVIPEELGFLSDRCPMTMEMLERLFTARLTRISPPPSDAAAIAEKVGQILAFLFARRRGGTLMELVGDVLSEFGPSRDLGAPITPQFFTKVRQRAHLTDAEVAQIQQELAQPGCSESFGRLGRGMLMLSALAEHYSQFRDK